SSVLHYSARKNPRENIPPAPGCPAAAHAAPALEWAPRSRGNTGPRETSPAPPAPKDRGLWPKSPAPKRGWFARRPRGEIHLPAKRVAVWLERQRADLRFRLETALLHRPARTFRGACPPRR